MSATLRGVTNSPQQRDYIPYVTGPSSPAPSAQHREHHTAPQPVAAVATNPVVVGESVDLAHELGALRKLQMTTMSLAGLALLFAFFAALFSGFVAYELWNFLGALHKALD